MSGSPNVRLESVAVTLTDATDGGDTVSTIVAGPTPSTVTPIVLAPAATAVISPDAETVATPIALGSWWGLISALLLVVGITWRIAAEERLLVAELPGYAAYRQTVRFRLIPRIW